MNPQRKEQATLELSGAGDRLSVQDQRSHPDYSEEAIPERDPAYRLPDGTLSQTRTVEHTPPAVRLDLVRRLIQLGMSASRAAVVASL